jgi:hypothetical protein
MSCCGVRVNLQLWYQLWQNRLNYSGSSALDIAIQPILPQRTSNGKPLGLLGLRSMQPRFNRWVYNHTTAHQLLIHRKLNIITNRFNFNTCIQTLFWNHKLCKLVGSHNGRKIVTRLHTSRKLTPNLAQTWCYSGGSLPAGDGSHSTDQPNGTEIGHAEPSVGFSRVIPEK